MPINHGVLYAQILIMKIILTNIHVIMFSCIDFNLYKLRIQSNLEVETDEEQSVGKHCPQTDATVNRT